MDINDPKSVNAIKETAHGDKLRSKGKAPTFLLTYGGSFRGLMTNCGFNQEEAKDIESRYHGLYVESDAWMEKKISEAAKKGYADLAFGGRIRCPVLHKTVLGSSYTPKAAASEARTVGNALGGQSYCQLNLRLGFKLMELVKEAGYEHDIKPVCTIHDATYVVVRDSATIVHWLNKTITELALWKDLPELYDPEIPLGGELDLFPRWCYPITLKVDSTKQDIIDAVNKWKANNKS